MVACFKGAASECAPKTRVDPARECARDARQTLIDIRERKFQALRVKGQFLSDFSVRLFSFFSISFGRLFPMYCDVTLSLTLV
jgi:hypothetical protein